MGKDETAQIDSRHQIGILQKTLYAWKTTASTFSVHAPRRAKMEALIELVEQSLGSEIECYVAKGRKVAYCLPGREINSDHKKLAAVPDSYADEDNAIFVRRVPVTDQEALIIVNNFEIEGEAIQERVKAYVEALNITPRKVPVKGIMAAVAITALLFVPIKLPTTGEAEAVGEHRMNITALNAGIVTPLSEPGMVAKGQPIAKIESNELDRQIELLSARIAELRSQSAQPAEQGTNVYTRLAAIHSSEAEKAGLEKQRQANIIGAPMDGMLAWESVKKLRYANAGDLVGSTDAQEQTLLEVRVAAKDIRPQQNQQGVFYRQDAIDNEMINGFIENTPTVIDVSKGRSDYLVNFRLEKPVLVGDTGMVSFNSEYTTIFKVLFKTTILHIRSWYSLYFD